MQNLLSRSERKQQLMQKQLWIILIVFILVLIVGGGAIFIFKPEWLPFTSSTASPTGSSAKVPSSKASGYVAVFLTNNQVYFGKLVDERSAYPVLRDVYYLRVQRSLVPAENEDANIKVEDQKSSPPPQQQQNELTLIKMGSELHGPVDEIKLNKDHILYIEDLKEDSKVVKAIREFQQKK